MILDGNLIITDETPPASLECVVEVTSSLELRDTSTWVDLSPLESLVSVGGDLWITGNTGLTSVDGLEALTSVGGSVEVSANPTLVQLDGLSNLTTFESITVGFNAALVSLPQLQGELNITGPGVIVSSNDALADLDGFAEAFVAEGTTLVVVIESMPALTSLDGLSGIATTSDDFSLDVRDVPLLTQLNTFGAHVGDVRLKDAPLLQNLDGFAATTHARSLSFLGVAAPDLSGLGSLVEVEQTLRIGNCTPDASDTLTSLGGLDQLERVPFLAVTGNGELTDISALGALVEVSQLWITNNPALPSAQVDALVTALPDATPTICGNDEDPLCRQCPPQPN